LLPLCLALARTQDLEEDEEEEEEVEVKGGTAKNAFENTERVLAPKVVVLEMGHVLHSNESFYRHEGVMAL